MGVVGGGVRGSLQLGQLACDVLDTLGGRMLGWSGAGRVPGHFLLNVSDNNGNRRIEAQRPRYTERHKRE